MRVPVVVAMLVAGCGRIGFDALGAGDGGGSDTPGDGPGTSCFRGLATGRMSTCAIDARGDVWCWGHNGERESNPAVLSGYTLAPTKVVLPAPAAQIRIGSQFACARFEDGRVFCWGNNDSGELGNGTQDDGGPTEVLLGAERAKELAIASITACIVRESDGGVTCWGGAADGLLSAQSSVPVSIPLLTNVHGLEMAHRHACVLDASNHVWCWGRANSGQIGPPLSNRTIPVEVTSFGAQIALAAGGKSTCALDAAGDVRCLGTNDLGELGDGSFVTRSTPSAPVVSGAIAIGGGSKTNCALLAGGSVSCWGSGASGMLGDGGYDTRPLPGNASTLVSSLAVGFHHICGLTDDQILCWGRNGEAQLGRGARSVARTPQVWGTPTQPQLFLAAGERHYCQVQNSVAQCWGLNTDGQLGDGTRTSRYAAITVPLPFTPVGIAAGGFTTCAFSSGETMCWGNGQQGQIGDGSIHLLPRPPTSNGLVGVVQMSLAATHACAISAAGAFCWGSNQYGQLAAGAAVQRTRPTIVNGLTAPSRISAGSQHTCAIHTVGGANEATCWGANFRGQLGDGSITERSTVGGSITLPGAPIEITAGYEHSCAIIVGGAVYCWGRNDGQESGVPGSADELSPQRVMLPGPAATISAAWRGTCATLTDQRVFCWGVGGYGELGNGTSAAISLPVEVSGITNARLVARSGSGACAALANGRVACWGNAEAGLLGSGLGADVATPMAVPLSCMP